MLPLKIAILWHHHQPYYLKDEKFVLPWVRLHGIKDYYDLPELLHEFPEIKQTFNLVPSLMEQILLYGYEGYQDTVQTLTKIATNKLNDDDKANIIKLFFKCNADNMILPYPRYNELYQKAKDVSAAINNFNYQDWLDLQVWYNLTWMGQYSRKNPKIARLFTKGSNFTEEEKEIVFTQQLSILQNIHRQYLLLLKLNQIEISVSPMYHPILPLLCNLASAREAMPDVLLPETIFKYPEDARAQIEYAINYYSKYFYKIPSGMWPSEGSISDEVLEIISQSGIKWVASDEQILSFTRGDEYISTEKFFPRKFITETGEIAIFFRDHFLSDNIGFVYSKWDPKNAAIDFCGHLNNIRKEIIKNHGEDSLNYAVVPVILDGENCWEYYIDNGVPFLKCLYSELSNKEEFKTVTFSESLSGADFLPSLNHIRAGSWINANFNIWIGHNEDRIAWLRLSEVRAKFEELKSRLTKIQLERAIKNLMIAEGSDWFWWYGDEHSSEDKPIFDELFRYYIKEVYNSLDEPIPDSLNLPIGSQEVKPVIVMQQGEVFPIIDGKLSDSEKWDKAGYFDARSSLSTMHKVGEILGRLWFASDSHNIYFRCDTIHQLRKDESIELIFMNPTNFKIEITLNGLKIISDNQLPLKRFVFASDEVIEFSFSRDMLFSRNNFGNILELLIITKSNEGQLNYPLSGKLELKIV